MTGKELERLLASQSPRTPAELDHIGRALREAELVPNLGPGPRAPDYSADHAAAFLIALAATPKLAETAATAKRYSRLEPTKAAFAGARTLADALAVCLSDPTNARGVAAVEINKTFAVATIRTKTGREYVYGAPSSDDVKPIADVTRITSGILSMIAQKLAGERTRGGWGERK